MFRIELPLLLAPSRLSLLSISLCFACAISWEIFEKWPYQRYLDIIEFSFGVWRWWRFLEFWSTQVRIDLFHPGWVTQHLRNQYCRKIPVLRSSRNLLPFPGTAPSSISLMSHYHHHFYFDCWCVLLFLWLLFFPPHHKVPSFPQVRYQLAIVFSPVLFSLVPPLPQYSLCFKVFTFCYLVLLSNSCRLLPPVLRPGTDRSLSFVFCVSSTCNVFSSLANFPTVSKFAKYLIAKYSRQFRTELFESTLEVHLFQLVFRCFNTQLLIIQTQPNRFLINPNCLIHPIHRIPLTITFKAVFPTSDSPGCGRS